MPIILSITALALAGCAGQSAYFKPDQTIASSARTIDGTQYVSLQKLCAFYGVNYKWDPYAATAKLEKGRNEIALRAGSAAILVNGAHKKMDRAAVLSAGEVYVPMSFVRNNFGSVAGGMADETKVKAAVTPSSTPVAPAAAVGYGETHNIRTVVIDAGHGGRDVGATGRRFRLREKNMNLSVAKKVGSILEKAGIRVIYTRKNDTFISLQRRADIANNAKADLFVSIHINASRSKSLSGFECYYLSEATDDNARALEAAENSSVAMNEKAQVVHSRQLDKTLWDLTLTENRMESSELAGYICDSIEASRAINVRGVRSARFYVLKHTRMPGVLVEVGYLSNRADEIKLKDPAFLDRMAELVAAGVINYKKEYERTEGFSHR